MQQLLPFVPLLGFLLVFEPIAAGPPDPMIHRMHNKFPRVKNISKRNIECPPPKKILSGNNCCDQCEPGYFKETDCTKTQKTICKMCEEGQEYMDDYNYLSECSRCGSCDSAHGLEVDEPCTRFKNVKCRCKHGHFCNSSEPCHHCDPCTECEDGIVVKECTPISDTICGEKQDRRLIIGIVTPLVLIVLAIVTIILWKYCCKQTVISKKTYKDEQKPVEMERLIYPDIDLTPHLSDIAEEMSLPQVTKFVRKQGMSSRTIENTNLENTNDPSERKIKLLERWYQEKGIKDAYGTLMRSLRDLKMRGVADKIERNMNPSIEQNKIAHHNVNVSHVEEISNS